MDRSFPFERAPAFAPVLPLSVSFRGATAGAGNGRSPGSRVTLRSRLLNPVKELMAIWDRRRRLQLRGSPRFAAGYGPEAHEVPVTVPGISVSPCERPSSSFRLL